MIRRTCWVIATSVLVLGSAATAQLPIDVSFHFSPQPQSTGSYASKLCARDIDGDGFVDIVATEPGADILPMSNAGRAWVVFGPAFESSTAISMQAAQPSLVEAMGRGGCSVGDVDGDGALDILVGAPDYHGGLPDPIGRAHLFFGPDYQTSTVFLDPTPQQNSRFGASVLLADVNGDGRADVFVGAPYAGPSGLPPGSGEVYHWNATDLLTWTRLTSPQPVDFGLFGSSLDIATLDDSSAREILIGSDGHMVSGLLFRFDGPTLQHIDTVEPPLLAALQFGDVSFEGDLTGDGIDDLLVEAPFTHNPDSLDCDGAVFLMQGPFFTTASYVFIPVAADCSDGGDGFGRESAVLDLDADGALDVAIWQPSFPGNDDRVQVFFGPDWRSVQSLGGGLLFNPHPFGYALAAGDIDGDMHEELMVGATSVGAFAVCDVQTLTSDVTSLSLGAGGDVHYSLDLGPDHGGEIYLAALSLSGEWPGLVVAPGVYFPLNVDVLTYVGLSLVSTPVLPGFVGVLDAGGKAAFTFHVGAGMFPSLAGESLTVTAIAATSGSQPTVGSSGATVSLDP